MTNKRQMKRTSGTSGDEVSSYGPDTCRHGRDSYAKENTRRQVNMKGSDDMGAGDLFGPDIPKKIQTGYCANE